MAPQNPGKSLLNSKLHAQHAKTRNCSVDSKGRSDIPNPLPKLQTRPYPAISLREPLVHTHASRSARLYVCLHILYVLVHVLHVYVNVCMYMRMSVCACVKAQAVKGDVSD